VTVRGGVLCDASHRIPCGLNIVIYCDYIRPILFIVYKQYRPNIVFSIYKLLFIVYINTLLYRLLCLLYIYYLGYSLLCL